LLIVRLYYVQQDLQLVYLLAESFPYLVTLKMWMSTCIMGCLLFVCLSLILPVDECIALYVRFQFTSIVLQLWKWLYI